MDSKQVSMSRGCGFNCSGQVTGESNSTANALQRVTLVPHFHESSMVMVAKWNYTIVGECDTNVRFWLLGSHGCREIEVVMQFAGSSPYFTLEGWTLVGNDFEPLGAVDPCGRLYKYEVNRLPMNPSPRLVELVKPSSPRVMLTQTKIIKHIAVTDTLVVSILVVDLYEPTYTIVGCYPSFERLVKWYETGQITEDRYFAIMDPGLEVGNSAFEIQPVLEYTYHRVETGLKGLIAGATAFAAWDDKDVYTWGSSTRHQELGRTPEPQLEPAHVPHTVKIFEGLGGGIKKVVAQGPWYLALTGSGDLYMWGNSQACTIELDEGGPWRLPDILDDDDSDDDDHVHLVPLPEDHEVLDVAVGAAHLVIITDDHQLYGIGDNRHCELPIHTGEMPTIAPIWQDCGVKADRVWAGLWTTFYTRAASHEDVTRAWSDPALLFGETEVEPAVVHVLDEIHAP